MIENMTHQPLSSEERVAVLELMNRLSRILHEDKVDPTIGGAALALLLARLGSLLPAEERRGLAQNFTGLLERLAQDQEAA